MQDLRGLRRDGLDDLRVVVAAGMDGDTAREVDELMARVGLHGRADAVAGDLVRLEAQHFGQQPLVVEI